MDSVWGEYRIDEEKRVEIGGESGIRKEELGIWNQKPY
jgi:hypothetical protein